jgi:hypothetical protein
MHVVNRRIAMKLAIAPAAWVVAAVVAAAMWPSPAPAAAESGAMGLASHRAVYDLKLSQTRGKRPIQSVRGRILYDFSGNSCEGYALQFRQVSELDNGEGRAVVSDLRATTWEDAFGKRLSFHSENYLNDSLRDAVDGQADRARGGIAVRLNKPDNKTFDVDLDLVFPTEHVRRIIAAGKAGKSLLEVSVYDGSENGEKIYDTLTVIGKQIGPGAAQPGDATSSDAALTKLARWPVSISYFDRAAKGGGEQTPVYAINFELYENGVSRALLLDYNDFVLTGEMTSLEMKPAKACP